MNQAKRFKIGCMAALLLSVILLAGIAITIVTVERTTRDLPQRYAAMNVGYEIAEFIGETKGRWPASWDELKRHVMAQDNHQQHDFDWYIENVRVKWGVDVAELREAESPEAPPYPVVTTKDRVMAGPTLIHEANRNIWRAFNEGAEPPPRRDTISP